MLTITTDFGYMSSDHHVTAIHVLTGSALGIGRGYDRLGPKFVGVQKKLILSINFTKMITKKIK